MISEPKIFTKAAARRISEKSNKKGHTNRGTSQGSASVFYQFTVGNGLDRSVLPPLGEGAFFISAAGVLSEKMIKKLPGGSFFIGQENFSRKDLRFQ